jgi:transcriptional regulator with XRE-family HTH domain
MNNDDVKAFRKKLGVSIAKRRELAGLTQEQVAEQLGIGNEAVSRIERGVVEPSAVRMMQLADVFNCSVTVFFEESSGRIMDYADQLNNEMAGLNQEQQQFVLGQAIELSRFLRV